ncbi:16S rRNA (guanine(527)-N(7))-methyltransferase RsmG [Ferrovum sp. PN-J185]|uniref:16S rRNA (guanine(527)-N(7))-methyltransferase RsmG n=1 Tax=Ferrovum sp. PN-J185 TaxID=1356306 RepID=UPI0007950630|nr:16S rRNA (guanine(527)-N(7))-methyltransferase RsmG [Ferrovum sp. PN-J185]KXW55915.1 ribosomal RNA small subunit methyltransferase G [Ferrovum sp. PN-J185]MCC6068696.1 16S rRNA (guanine(527)-N(7))-methyltransferase RsmG [Ferrovum sp. PN-J185]MDE1891899.1 16S rRNA (guanine(527)-N(7))-methyltransferase RsmG [Betaproteobacteria bacterium]
MTHNLEEGLASLGITVSTNQIAQLNAYLDLLEKWNRTINLTAVRDRNQMILLHLLDSLSVNNVLVSAQVTALLDVGSGAGLPAIPLQIVNPQWQVSAVESNQKKCAFLRQAKLELSLDSFSVLNERVEQVEGLRFPCIISRAFSDLTDFVERTKHLLTENGFWVAMKGVVPYEEMEKLQKNYVFSVDSLTVPGLNAQRHALIIKNR